MAIYTSEKGKTSINTKGCSALEIAGTFLIKDGKAVFIAILSVIILIYTKHIGYSLIPESVFIPKFFTIIADWFKK